MHVFESTRLRFVEYDHSDFDRIHPIVSDPVTMKFWEHPFTRERTEAWIARSIESYAVNGFGRWLTVLKETGEVIGDCGFIATTIDGHDETDIGYIIHYPFHRQGFGYEAASACRDYAFDTLNLERLCATMATDHTASRRVAEKIGMTFVGEFLNPRNRNLPTRKYILYRREDEF